MGEIGGHQHAGEIVCKEKKLDGVADILNLSTLSIKKGTKPFPL